MFTGFQKTNKLLIVCFVYVFKRIIDKIRVSFQIFWRQIFCLFVSFLTAWQCDLHIPWVGDMKNTFSCEIKNLMLALQGSYRGLWKLAFASWLVK